MVRSYMRRVLRSTHRQYRVQATLETSTFRVLDTVIFGDPKIFNQWDMVHKTSNLTLYQLMCPGPRAATTILSRSGN